MAKEHRVELSLWLGQKLSKKLNYQKKYRGVYSSKALNIFPDATDLLRISSPFIYLKYWGETSINVLLTNNELKLNLILTSM